MTKRSTVALLCAGLVVASALTGCGEDPQAPGVTDSEIRVGTTMALSGPLAGSGAATLGGVKAYFQGINDSVGGVSLKDGETRKLRLIHYDDGHDPTRAVANYRKLVDKDRVFALVQTFGVEPNRALMEHANRDKVPHLFVHSGLPEFSADQQGHPWTIGWQPLHQNEGFWLARHLTARHEKLRVAVLSLDDEVGKAFVAGFEHAIEGSKVKVVARQTYQPGAETLKGQVAKLARSKADVLFSVVDLPRLQAEALREVRKLDWDSTVVLTSLSSSVRHVITPSGVTDGVRATGFMKDADDPQWASDSDVREYLARMREYSPDADPANPNAQWGYSAAATFARALAGMSHISREDLLEAVDELVGELPLLLPGVKLDAGPPDLPPVQGVWMQEFRNGEWFLMEPEDDDAGPEESDHTE